MAVGESARPLYEMVDELAGGGDDRPAISLVLDELVRWTSGPDLRAFVEDFKRHRPEIFEPDDCQAD